MRSPGLPREPADAARVVQPTLSSAAAEVADHLSGAAARVEERGPSSRVGSSASTLLPAAPEARLAPSCGARAPYEPWPGARWRWESPRRCLRHRLRLRGAGGHRAELPGAGRAGAGHARARGCATPASTRCRCGPTTPTTTCPTTSPSAAARARAWTTRSRDRPRARWRGDCPPRGCSGRSAARAWCARTTSALSWVHWSWFLVPHGTLAYMLLRHPEHFPRSACLMAATFDLGLRGLLGAAHRAALVRGAGRADGAGAADHGRGGRAVLERPLASALRWAGRQPLRCHALTPLRYIRDGRPRALRRGQAARGRSAGPTRSRWASAWCTWASTTWWTWPPGLPWPRRSGAPSPVRAAAAGRRARRIQRLEPRTA